MAGKPPPAFVSVTVRGMVEQYDETKILQLLDKIQKQNDDLHSLMRVGQRLSNCCHNAANAGGFRDHATGASAQQVAEVLRDVVKQWDYIESAIKGHPMPDPRPITERR